MGVTMGMHKVYLRLGRYIYTRIPLCTLAKSNEHTKAQGRVIKSMQSPPAHHELGGAAAATAARNQQLGYCARETR
jgi:hypothetical protein